MNNENRMKILVVEDDLVLCRTVALILTRKGYEVDVARSGIDALEMMRENRYDLHILDIKLPGMDGMKLTQHVKRDYAGLMNRLIYITGDVIDTKVQRFLSQVDRPYLLKPFNTSQLMELVAAALHETCANPVS
ncbi:response regulator [Bacteroidota bacterium]